MCHPCLLYCVELSLRWPFDFDLQHKVTIFGSHIGHTNRVFSCIDLYWFFLISAVNKEFLDQVKPYQTSKIRIHNPEVEGSTPSLATKVKAPFKGLFCVLPDIILSFLVHSTFEAAVTHRMIVPFLRLCRIADSNQRAGMRPPSGLPRSPYQAKNINPSVRQTAIAQDGLPA